MATFSARFGGCNGYTKHQTRFYLLFTPTSSSWLNPAKCFFAELAEKSVRRRFFKNVDELEAAIHSYLNRRNEDPE